MNVLNTKTESTLKLFNIDDDQYWDDNRAVNGGTGPTVEKILALLNKLGQTGSCFILEFYIQGEALGHYVSLQRVRAQEIKEWGPEGIGPVRAEEVPKDWQLEDFQTHRTRAFFDETLPDGTLRVVIGQGKQVNNGYNSSPDILQQWKDRVAAAKPLPNDRLKTDIRTSWDAARKQWAFDISHRGNYVQ